MSNDLFPVLPGLEWNFRRIPMHKTTVKETVSGREFRFRRMLVPRYTYRGSYEFLRDRRQGHDELRTLLGFFNVHGGKFDSWLFDDTDDNSATAQAFGVGDGVTPTFQLVRNFGGSVEPVFALNGAAQIFDNGTLRTAGVHYTINSTGGVTFTPPPVAAHVLTWTGAFYWRCRFLEDQHEYSRFSWKLWNLKSCDFITCKP